MESPFFPYWSLVPPLNQLSPACIQQCHFTSINDNYKEWLRRLVSVNPQRSDSSTFKWGVHGSSEEKKKKIWWHCERSCSNRPDSVLWENVGFIYHQRWQEMITGDVWGERAALCGLPAPENGALFEKNGPPSIPPCQSVTPTPLCTHTHTHLIHPLYRHSEHCVISGGSVVPPFTSKLVSTNVLPWCLCSFRMKYK